MIFTNKITISTCIFQVQIIENPFILAQLSRCAYTIIFLKHFYRCAAYTPPPRIRMDQDQRSLLGDVCLPPPILTPQRIRMDEDWRSCWAMSPPLCPKNQHGSRLEIIAWQYVIPPPPLKKSGPIKIGYLCPVIYPPPPQIRVDQDWRSSPSNVPLPLPKNQD